MSCEMGHWMLWVLAVLVGGCLAELWRLLRALRLGLRPVLEKSGAVLDKAWQALDNANDAAERLEDAAGDIAETTENVKQREKRGLAGLLGWLGK